MPTWRWFRWIATISLLALVALLVTACGGSSRQSASSAKDSAAPALARGARPAESPTQLAPTAVSDQSGSPLGTSPTSMGTPPADAAFQRKIIMNADISLRVENAREAMAELQNLANYSRGYVVDAKLEGSDEGGWNAHVVLRIPAGNYSSALASIRELGTVRQERQYTEDVTDQYYDLETRIKIATEYEQQLRDLALKAETFEEWLKLTQQINETRVQIENMTGQLRRLQNLVEYSTLNVTLWQPAKGVEIRPEPKGLWDRMSQAFTESTQGVWELSQSLIVWLVALIPGLVFLAILAGFVWLLVLPFRRRFRSGSSRMGPPTPPLPPTPPRPPGASGPQGPPAPPTS